jgi:threonine/homoserine efflux transporter RhtA
MMSGIDQLGASMLIAAVVVTPVGLGGALRAFSHPLLLLAGAGVGVCSSVIPYVIDQLAMARLPRATFALMLALLPMFATIIGAIVLHQLPTSQDLAGVALVIAGVALHQVPGQAAPRWESFIGLRHGRNKWPRVRRHDAVRTTGLVGPEGVADLPGHDELRRSR